MLNLLKKPKKKTGSATILVVDDEQDLRSTVEFRLTHKKYRVITAANGQEGLTQANAQKPDLILLDTNMPVMNGHQMLEQLRKSPDIKDTPVIMVTAVSAPQDIAAASAFHVNDYITKPFDFAELLEKVEKVLAD